MKEKILLILKSNKDKFISGQSISKELGISRSAIWKYINQIKEDGYEIESVSRKGYRLISSPDILNSEEINSYLNTEYMGRNILHFDTIDSTNTKAKALADLGEPEGSVIISEEQTKGRGRLGKSWISPKYKGIWMSIVLRPKINPIHISKVTQIGAAAILKATEEMGINTEVKWPNDIILNNKKVCGILTEMSAELNQINYVIIGIGINVNIDFYEIPQDIKQIATSLKAEIGKNILRKEFVARILNNFERLYNLFRQEGNAKKSIDICRKKSIVIGKKIKIIQKDKELTARAIDINNEGELIVEYENGEINKLISGEVSVRGLYGYI